MQSSSNRIEEKIDAIYEFVESCKMQRMSTTKVIMPKDELYDLLDDLRRDVPEEIKRYQKILRQRDAILEDAESKAAAILSDAQEQYKALVRRSLAQGIMEVLIHMPPRLPRIMSLSPKASTTALVSVMTSMCFSAINRLMFSLRSSGDDPPRRRRSSFPAISRMAFSA